MSDQVLLTVGNSMMGDDGAGPLLSSLLDRAPAPGWQVVDGGSAPENVVHRVRALSPWRVVVVDATDMDLEPGAIRLVDDRRIADQFIMTTHDLPVCFLIAALRESVPEVAFLGIQPALVAFGCPMSAAVERAVRDIHAQLRSGCAIDHWPSLEAPAPAPRRTTWERERGDAT